MIFPTRKSETKKGGDDGFAEQGKEKVDTSQSSGALGLCTYPGLMRTERTVDYPPRTRLAEMGRAEWDLQAPPSLHPRASTHQGELK